MSGLLAGIGFLMIGASQFAHEGYLISTLHDDLLNQGATMASYGACATEPHAWLRAPTQVYCGTAVRIGRHAVEEDVFDTSKTWRVADLIARHHPQIVIVGIADTLAGYRMDKLPVQLVKTEVQALVQKLMAEHVRCIWLGTTWGTEGGPLGKNYKRVKELNDLLKDITAHCEFIDSLALEKPGEWPTIDGQHHTSRGYELWGRALTVAIDHSETVRELKAAMPAGKPGG